jgi:hypothetical protein
MALTVAQMTKNELKELISDTVEKKLLDLFGDPEENFKLKESFKKRLLRQRKDVVSGDRGEKLENVVKRLGIK